MSINTFKDYADQYNCTLAEAIADRDFPMSLADCCNAFVEESGRKPTPEEIETMNADDDAAVREFTRDCRRDMEWM